MRNYDYPKIYNPVRTPYYGEMYNYANTDATPIDEADKYHAVIIKTAGTCSGFTFKVGSTGVIATFANYNATVAGTTLITDEAHGLLTGEIITIANSTNYNGAYVITKVSADTFYIVKNYAAEAGGMNWVRGSSLKAGGDSAGIYRISFSATLAPAGANDLYKFELNQGITALDNMAASNKFVAASDYKNISSTGLATISVNDYIWLSCKNETDTDDLTVRHGNISISKI